MRVKPRSLDLDPAPCSARGADLETAVMIVGQQGAGAQIGGAGWCVKSIVRHYCSERGSKRTMLCGMPSAGRNTLISITYFSISCRMPQDLKPTLKSNRAQGHEAVLEDFAKVVFDGVHNLVFLHADGADFSH